MKAFQQLAGGDRRGLRGSRVWIVASLVVLLTFASRPLAAQTQMDQDSRKAHVGHGTKKAEAAVPDSAQGAPQPDSGPIELPPKKEHPDEEPVPIVSPSWVNPLGEQLREAKFEWRPAPDIWILPGAVMQLRYSLNNRDDPPTRPDSEGVLEKEHPITQGFILRRLRLIVDSHFTEHMRMFIRMGVNGTGDFTVERAYGDLFFSDNWRFRAGLFFIPGFAEEDPTPEDIIPVDYSNFANTFTSGATEGMSITGPNGVKGEAQRTTSVRGSTTTL